MKYAKTINIWEMSPEALTTLQIGQWVTAGGSKGIFLGVKKSGSVVVAWYHNALRYKNFREYVRTLRNYAKS